MSNAAADKDLVDRLKAQDAEAFSLAVDRFAPTMRRTAAAIVGDAAADDVVQESWISVVRKVTRFEGRSSLKTWLTTIVINQARSHLRKSGREQRQRLEPGEDEPLEALFDQRGYWKGPVSDWGSDMPDGLLQSEELEHCFRIHLDRLPEQQKEALVLRELNGMSFEEICEALDVSAANARVLLHRARLALYQMVEGFRETGEC